MSLPSKSTLSPLAFWWLQLSCASSLLIAGHSQQYSSCAYPSLDNPSSGVPTSLGSNAHQYVELSFALIDLSVCWVSIWVFSGNWLNHCDVVYQWGITAALVNLSILPNFCTATMCWQGIPFIFGNPHVHFPNLDPNVSLFGMFTLYSLWLVEFLLTIGVCSFLCSVKWTLNSCTLTLLNASSINSIPFGVSTCAWFHAKLCCLLHRVLSFLSKIRVVLSMSTAVFWWMSSFALFIASTPKDALLPYKQTESPSSQEGIVDLQKFIFDAQYVLYLQTVYFISQQYIVLQSNLVDLTKIYFWRLVRTISPNSIFYLTIIYCLAIQFNVFFFFA